MTAQNVTEQFAELVERTDFSALNWLVKTMANELK